MAKRISTLQTLRHAQPAMISAAGLSLAVAAGGTVAIAQQGQTSSGSETALPVISVQGGSGPNTYRRPVGVSRLPGTVQDTPQTIDVISEEVMKQQQVTTLDQALRNSPGITSAIGEGNGGMNGDQFRIRGFQAKGDIYTDGLRDFGVYVRDSFAIEEVQVIKGPSSESYGMGTTGGAINARIKQAHDFDSYSIDAQGGSGPLGRVVVDINKTITDTSAFRIVAMGHKQDLVDRDHVFSDRVGVLGDIGFGIGEDTEWHLTYFHQSGWRMPDFGVPIIDEDGAGPILGRPVTEYGVPRSNYYGKETDRDEHGVHALTSKLRSEVTGWLTVYNDTRLSYYDRYLAQTVPNCAGVCLTSVVNGTFTGAYGFGGPAGYDQESWGAQNITTGVAEFATGPFRHELVAGVDLLYEADDRTQLQIIGAKVPGTIGNPDFSATGYTVVKNPNSTKWAEATNVGVFASDRVWIFDQFSLLGGVRWDDYRASYEATTNGGVTWTEADTHSSFLSPKASAIWEPTEYQTYYASWAKSFTPPGQFITNDNVGVPTGPGQADRDPEVSELWELGAKIAVLDGRLGFSGAVFQVTKDNATITDPNTGAISFTGDVQRVRGVELGVSGAVTEAWTVQAGYAYYDSEIIESATVANEGNEVPFVSKHNLALWTTYDIAQHMPSIPGELLVGGGLIYASDQFVNAGNTAFLPDTVLVDAVVSWEWEQYRLAFNGYNLTDELYYSSGFGNRAVVGPGRTLALTFGLKF